MILPSILLDYLLSVWGGGLQKLGSLGAEITGTQEGNTKDDSEEISKETDVSGKKDNQKGDVKTSSG